jgi:NAD(P)-dependent dehydrogenase (short-subunit alcohol dehydrogenase family)
MKILKNKTAAVTGAASGLGRMLAVRLAGIGAVSRRIAKAYVNR